MKLVIIIAIATHGYYCDACYCIPILLVSGQYYACPGDRVQVAIFIIMFGRVFFTCQCPVYVPWF